MRRREPIDPVAARELAAIDAALSGGASGPHGPIAPEDAALTELATLLVAERPTAAPAFRAQLDARVSERFALPDPRAAERRARAGGTDADGGVAGTLRRIRSRALIPSFAATVAVALVALVIALQPSGGESDRDTIVSGGALAPQTTKDTAGGGASTSESPEATQDTAGAGASTSESPAAAAAPGGAVAQPIAFAPRGTPIHV